MTSGPSIPQPPPGTVFDTKALDRWEKGIYERNRQSRRIADLWAFVNFFGAMVFAGTLIYIALKLRGAAP